MLGALYPNWLILLNSNGVISSVFGTLSLLNILKALWNFKGEGIFHLIFMNRESNFFFSLSEGSFLSGKNSVRKKTATRFGYNIEDYHPLTQVWLVGSSRSQFILISIAAATRKWGIEHVLLEVCKLYLFIPAFSCYYYWEMLFVTYKASIGLTHYLTIATWCANPI